MDWVVVGGSGFIGSAITAALTERKCEVTVVDQRPPKNGGVEWICADILVDTVQLPAGHVVLAQGNSMPRPVRPWTLVRDNALATARLREQLRGRTVTLLSSIEVYGGTPGPLVESMPGLLADIGSDWLDRAVRLAAEPCPPHRVHDLCQEVVDLDPTGRWAYALSKVAQERVLADVPAALTVLRLANVVGVGQWRFLGRLLEAHAGGTPLQVTDCPRSFVDADTVARVVAEMQVPGVVNVSVGTAHLLDVARWVGEETGTTTRLDAVAEPQPDSCGVVDNTLLRTHVDALPDVEQMLRKTISILRQDTGPMFLAPLPVVIPPRPEHPGVVADRIAESLWTGRVRGQRWTAELTAELRRRLQLGPDRQVLPTNSGTNALRLAVDAVARPGAVAICPAFTFHATAEVLQQLGYRIRFADVDPATWTVDPRQVAQLVDEDVAVVVTVDALGNPCDYPALRAACGPVPLVADSAAALGASLAGVPIGSQADAHAFSMSFAKTVSAGGSGGAVVLPAGAVLDSPANWLRSTPITEMSAVVGLDSLRAVDELVRRRQQVAEIYSSTLQSWLIPQTVVEGNQHSWVHWVAMVPERIGRDRAANALAAEGIGTKPYYESIRGVSPRPVSGVLQRRALALPMSSELSVDEAERVAMGARRALRSL